MKPLHKLFDDPLDPEWVPEVGDAVAAMSLNGYRCARFGWVKWYRPDVRVALIEHSNGTRARTRVQYPIEKLRLVTRTANNPPGEKLQTVK